MNKLLPCPFCGGEVRWCSCDDKHCNRIACGKCGLEALWNYQKRTIKKRWNARTEPTDTPDAP